MHQLASEVLKMRTTRTAGLLLLAATGVTALGAALEGASPTLAALARQDTQRNLFGAGVTAVLFATFAGLLAVTSEFRYGTIRPTLLVEPRRRIVLAAKLATAGLAGVVFAVVCLGVAFGAGLAILSAREVDVSVTREHALTLVFGTIASSALGGMLGVTLGMLIRNQVGAIVTLVVYAFTVDAVLFATVPSLGRYLPGKAGDGLAGLPDHDLLNPAAGAAVLAGWTLALITAAVVRNDRSDV